MIINKNFKRKRTEDIRLPPGQYETNDFPVLSLGPTPKVSKQDWSLEITGLVKNPIIFNWDSFLGLRKVNVKKDIHCVTRWSKFDTNWKGVLIDEIIKKVIILPPAKYLIAYSYDGYSTNLPLNDVINGKALVALEYDGKEITPEHGGPARLIVPHLYFWKSAKWLNKIEFSENDRPGFWETRGYHNYGDPDKEQRFTE